MSNKEKLRFPVPFLKVLEIRNETEGGAFIQLTHFEGGRELKIMKNRNRQRENRRIKEREERLSKRNAYGNKDLTAFNAIRKIQTGGKAEIDLGQNHEYLYKKPGKRKGSDDR